MDKLIAIVLDPAIKEFERLAALKTTGTADCVHGAINAAFAALTAAGYAIVPVEPTEAEAGAKAIYTEIKTRNNLTLDYHELASVEKQEYLDEARAAYRAMLSANQKENGK